MKLAVSVGFVGMLVLLTGRRQHGAEADRVLEQEPVQSTSSQFGPGEAQGFSLGLRRYGNRPAVREPMVDVRVQWIEYLNLEVDPQVGPLEPIQLTLASKADTMEGFINYGSNVLVTDDRVDLPEFNETVRVNHGPSIHDGSAPNIDGE